MFSLQLTVALILIFSVLILLPLIQSDVSVANPLVDRDSFLTKQVALQLFQQAAQQSTTNITLALLTYNRSYILYPNFLSAEAIGWLYEVGGDSVKAQEWYTLALSIDHQQLASRVAQSTFYVRKGDFNSAKTLIHQILADEEHFADAHYSIGTLNCTIHCSI